MKAKVVLKGSKVRNYPNFQLVVGNDPLQTLAQNLHSDEEIVQCLNYASYNCV